MQSVVLIGRPNVGKSTLFNRLCKKRIAIVNDEAGVTRDFLQQTIVHGEHTFELLDSPGWDPTVRDFLCKEAQQQTALAIEKASIVLMLIDGTVDLQEADLWMADLIRKTGKKTYVVVNKADHPQCQKNCGYPLGFGDPILVSAEHGTGIIELLEALLPHVEDTQVPSTPSLRLALFGRPNAGKSTLTNTLLGYQRSLVSTIPGTTRDNVYAHITLNQQAFTLVDTAGFRKVQSEKSVLDKFAAMRMRDQMGCCDVALLILDSTQGPTVQDKRLARLLAKEGKGTILWYNKWDLVQNTRMEHAEREARQRMPYLPDAPIVFGSAKTGRNVEKLIEAAVSLHQRQNAPVATSALNKAIAHIYQTTPPPRIQGRQLKIYYGHLKSHTPLVVSLNINSRYNITHAWERYLINALKKQFHWQGIPLQIMWHDKKELARKREE